MLDVVNTCMQFIERIERSRVGKAATRSVSAAIAGVCLIANWQAWSAPDANIGVSITESPHKLAALLALPSERIVRVDVARMNLLCADGLPGAAVLDLKKYLVQIDDWAARVRQETERHQYRGDEIDHYCR